MGKSLTEVPDRSSSFGGSFCSNASSTIGEEGCREASLAAALTPADLAHEQRQGPSGLEVLTELRLGGGTSVFL